MSDLYCLTALCKCFILTKWYVKYENNPRNNHDAVVLY
ncbi:hypothetical protein QUC_1376 [Clostridioides difficile P50]|nr:hypothetical protein QUC_1376 [Clostridioides difficile P50]